MVKITNSIGDIKRGRQGEAVYQGHYGQQIRRTVKPKTGEVSKMQLAQRTRFQQTLAWRATLSHQAKLYLDGYSIAHRIIDDFGIPLTWDKLALKIGLQQPKVTVLD